MTKTKAHKDSQHNGQKSVLPASKLKPFKNELLKMEKDLTTTLETKKEKDLEITTAPTPGDDADVATETYEKEMFFEISDNERESLKQVQDALRKIDNKSFGVCELCKKPIPLKRLKVIPYTRYCLPCQSQYESRV